MKFSYQWLKEYVDVKLSPQALADMLTRLGLEVENYSECKDNDFIFDLELTSNRPDCANMVGLAREIGTALKKRVKYPKVSITEGLRKIEEFVKVEVKDEALCPRYAARCIRGVKVKPSPQWLRLCLEKLGLRSINNVVDITNYVLMELGHPLHAFDADTLSENKLVIRRAKNGEKIITIDLLERKLSNDMLVIADGRKPQAIAGIMGGIDSEVKGTTKNILLESAYFNKETIRRTGKSLNMLTEASYRFERGADPESLIFALNRTAGLIEEIAGGEIAQGIIDIYKKPIPRKTLDLNLDNLNRVLGAKVTISQIKDIFKHLEFKIKSSSKHEIKVLVPAFRGDITREIDLIEEGARHYGYNRIEAKLPKIRPRPAPIQLEKKIRDTALDTLLKCRLQEVINYSFINTGSLIKLNLDEAVLGKKFIKINNPISQDQDTMRPTLLLGLLNNISWNFNRGTNALKIFEIGKIFYNKGGKKKFAEKTSLAFTLAQKKGRFTEKKNTALNLFDLKGLVETLFEALGISSFKLERGAWPCFHPQNSAWIIKNKKRIGLWGEFNSIVTERFGLKGKFFGAEIVLDELLPWVDLNKQFKTLPRFPAVERDLSLLVPIELTSGEIISLIKEAGTDLIERIDLFDVYRGKQVPEGFRSLTYNLIYRSSSRTLTDEIVNDIHQKISQQLKDKLKLKIRGG